jgi:replicative DNA helicase
LSKGEERMHSFQNNSQLGLIPPQNIEVEQCVIGSILLIPSSALLAFQVLASSDFYKNNHQIIFEHFVSMFDRSENIDIVTLSESLKSSNQLEEVGGPAYLASLTTILPSKVGMKGYCDIVKEKSTLRKMITMSHEIISTCYSGSVKGVDIINLFGGEFFNICSEKNSEAEKIESIIPRVFKAIEDRKKNGISGTPTGFYDLDRIICGFEPSDLVVLAARPSMGKTAMAMNIIENVTKTGKACVVYSLEMSKDRLVERMISGESGISGTTLKRGTLEDGDWPKLTRAAGMLSKVPVYIDDGSGLSVTQIRSRAKSLNARKRLGMVVVDYIGLMEGKGENKTQQIANISAGLKGLAKELNIPVLVLSQLNRNLESRTNKEPQMSDLRESGAIEQDADIIIFIYRDEVYNKSPDNPLKGTAKIIVSKNRNGRIGDATLSFDEKLTRFGNLANEGYY